MKRRRNKRASVDHLSLQWTILRVKLNARKLAALLKYIPFFLLVIKMFIASKIGGSPSTQGVYKRHPTK